MAYSHNAESNLKKFVASSSSVIFKNLFLFLAVLAVIRYLPRKAKISTHESLYVALGVVGANYLLDTFVPDEHQVLSYLAGVTRR